MKTVNMVKALFIIICLAIFKITCAQDYIVTLSADTIQGEVKLLTFGVEPKVQLAQEGKKKSVHSILQVRALKMEGEIYHTVRTSDSYAFMKLIKGGYLSLYAFQQSNQTGWNGRFLATKDGRIMELPNLGFKKRVSSFLEDCATVSVKVEEGELSKNEIELIVEQYNQCIASKSFEVNTLTDQQTKQLNYWDELTNKLSSSNFEGKNDVKEMINEVKLKIQRSEKIPNFLIDGLKSSLKDQAELLEILNKALADLK
jgi:hypothetical protein